MNPQSKIWNAFRFPLNVALVTGLLLFLIGCGPSSPTGDRFLGRWEVEYAFDNKLGTCVLDVTLVGESFLMTNACTGNTGIIFAGVFTLTPEGNLSGGSQYGNLTIAFDDATGRAIASGVEGVQYLMRVPETKEWQTLQEWIESP